MRRPSIIKQKAREIAGFFVVDFPVDRYA